MRGGHHVKTWPVTQKRVTLSSAEAELGTLVKTSTEVIGILQMAEGLGRTTTAKVYVDSSAALAVVNRKGCGKLRHVRVGQLWFQEVAKSEELKYQNRIAHVVAAKRDAAATWHQAHCSKGYSKRSCRG